MWKIFPSDKEMIVMAIAIAVLGYSALRGCEAGCNYIGERYEVIEKPQRRGADQ